MPKLSPPFSGQKISEGTSIGAGLILATLIAAFSTIGWVYDRVPGKGEIETQDARSTRITNWVKEENAKIVAERHDAEMRLQKQIDQNKVESRADLIELGNRLLTGIDRLDSKVDEIRDRLPARGIKNAGLREFLKGTW